MLVLFKIYTYKKMKTEFKKMGITKILLFKCKIPGHGFFACSHPLLYQYFSEQFPGYTFKLSFHIQCLPSQANKITDIKLFLLQPLWETLYSIICSLPCKIKRKTPFQETKMLKKDQPKATPACTVVLPL